MLEAIGKNFKGDKVIWIIIMFLSLFSLLAVYSSTGTLAYKLQEGNTTYYMVKHFMFMMAGIVVMLVVHNIHYKYFNRYATIALWISIGLLMVTLVVGVNLNHASRWLVIPGLGFGFQPSEVAKLALILFISKTLAQHQEDDVPAKGAFKPILFYMGIVCLLIFPENFSTAALVGFTCMTLMFVGRVPFAYLLGVFVSIIVMITLVLMLSSHLKFLHRAETWKARIERFWNGEKDTEESQKANFQSDQAKMAVSTGGILGKGPGNSTQRNFLPHPYSDFIFAIIVEEYGLIGGLGIMILYLLLLFRAVKIARACTRTFPAFMVIGIATLMTYQGFINMGVAVGVFPVTGQTLPWVSMGGSSVLFTGFAFGAILSVSRSNQEEKEAEKNGTPLPSDYDEEEEYDEEEDSEEENPIAAVDANKIPDIPLPMPEY